MKRKPKVSKTAYTQNMLPQNRKEIFFDVIHLQWRNLLLLGLILLLFALPLLLSTIAEDIYIPNFYASVDPDTTEQQMEAAYALAYWEIGRSLVNTLLLVLFSVAVSGVCRIIRQYAWEENVHIPTDFVKGIKDNIMQMGSLFFLTGLIETLCLLVLYSAASYKTSFLAILSLLPIGISVLIVLPVFALCMVMIPVYCNRFSRNLKNAFSIYTQAPLKTLLAFGCCALVYVPSRIPNFYCHLFGGVICTLLTPFVLLAWTLFCYNQFDKYINKELCPELVNRGILSDSE